MKKTYMTPTLEVIRIENVQLMAGSFGNSDTPLVDFDEITNGGDGEYGD